MPKPFFDYSRILTQIAVEVRPLCDQGRVADYIPMLAAIPKSRFGIAVYTNAGKQYVVGDAEIAFSIQSISKVYGLTLALQAVGESLWERVGREPSGNAFNSLVQLEYEKGIPRNPFINAGALVVADIILSHYSNPKETLLAFVRARANNPYIQVDSAVAQSEKDTGFRNAALANFLKSFKNLDNEVSAVLDFYFYQCAIAMTCIDLAKSFRFLANAGICPWTNEAILTPSLTKRVNAIMLTSGTYDAAGDFVYRVGMPAKSGVGGGIVALIPNVLTTAVWSPGLNEKGNSLAGTMALELLTTKTRMSIF